MITKAEARQLLDAIKANSAKLRSCSGPHAFQSFDGPTLTGKPNLPSAFERLRCTRCGGEVSKEQADWYKRGLAHGQDAAFDRIKLMAACRAKLVITCSVCKQPWEDGHVCPTPP